MIHADYDSRADAIAIRLVDVDHPEIEGEIFPSPKKAVAWLRAHLKAKR
jgi:hypothetical protein